MTQKDPIKPVIPVREPNLRQRIVNKLLFLSLFVAALGIAQFLYWSFQSEAVLKVNNEPFPSRVVKDGPENKGILILNVDYCKDIAVEGNLRMSFVSQTREIFLPLTREKGEEGCQKVDFPVLLPKELQPDKYFVRFRAVYDINPLKKNVVSEFKSQEFELK